MGVSDFWYEMYAEWYFRCVCVCDLGAREKLGFLSNLQPIHVVIGVFRCMTAHTRFTIARSVHMLAMFAFAHLDVARLTHFLPPRRSGRLVRVHQVANGAAKPRLIDDAGQRQQGQLRIVPETARNIRKNTHMSLGCISIPTTTNKTVEKKNTTP